jgi:serine/threonine protein kinase
MESKTGGNVLGEGTYGCVFYPPLKCDNETTRRIGVGKVIRNIYDANFEIQISKRLLKIDPKGKFTNPLISECFITKQNITKKDESNLICGVTDTLDENKKYKQLIYKHKGNDLFTSHNNHINKFINLIEGLQVLQEHNICHRDIKEDNILSLKTKYIYIDFGLSVDLKDVYQTEFNNILMHTYMYYPPEFKIYAIMETLLKQKKYDNKDTLIDDIYNKLENIKHMKSYRSIKQELKDLGVYKNIRNDIYNSICRIVYETFNLSHKNKEKYFTKLSQYVDVFSLGVIMLSESNKQSLSLEKSKALNTIIKKAIHFDVFSRFNIHQLLDEFKSFLGHKRELRYVSIDQFTAKTLKSVAIKHSMKVSGNKQELYDRVKDYLKVNNRLL